ncbi:hypothetical protein H2O64_02575 [Kordia sp. YSTF-M3]|uniref:DUF4252 domain-containing protein n=1 Tax=Kordia aestuariivivens TaxID=2759037 RepID=A0ABR7Q4P9_9FLAO|nr:hypothetical protein [Kordia aestuariivivens]MBC8753539.1 hypothetical protein [Kordia aestuariivivens]
MKKITILIVSLLFLVSCKSVHTIYNKEKLQNIDKLGYVAPVYEYTENLKNTKAFKKFKKYSNNKIDSLFSVEATKYKISKKVSSNALHDVDIQNIFNAHRNNQKIDFTTNFKSLLKDSKEDYVMIIYLKPKFTLVNSSFLVTSASKMEVLLIETNTEEVIFYDSAYSSIRHTTKRLLDNVNEIYKKINEL